MNGIGTREIVLARKDNVLTGASVGQGQGRSGWISGECELRAYQPGTSSLSSSSIAHASAFTVFVVSLRLQIAGGVQPQLSNDNVPNVRSKVETI